MRITFEPLIAGEKIEAERGLLEEHIQHTETADTIILRIEAMQIFRLNGVDRFICSGIVCEGDGRG